eukprot:3869411-Pleurochrysis_carterae.AAC.4
MMTSRIAKNGRGVRGLLKKSAKLAMLDTKGTVMSCASTRSRTRKRRRSMADLLSIWSDVGSAAGSPRSSNIVRKYTASFVASDASMISASQNDKASQGHCFFDNQEIAA